MMKGDEYLNREVDEYEKTVHDTKPKNLRVFVPKKKKDDEMESKQPHDGFIIVGFNSAEELDKYVKARIARRCIQRAVCKSLLLMLTIGFALGMGLSLLLMVILK